MIVNGKKIRLLYGAHILVEGEKLDGSEVNYDAIMFKPGLLALPAKDGSKIVECFTHMTEFKGDTKEEFLKLMSDGFDKTVEMACQNGNDPT